MKTPYRRFLIPALLACLCVQPVLAGDTVWTKAEIDQLIEDLSLIEVPPESGRDADIRRRLSFLKVEALNMELGFSSIEIDPADIPFLHSRHGEPPIIMHADNYGTAQTRILMDSPGEPRLMALEITGYGVLGSNFYILFRELSKNVWRHIHTLPAGLFRPDHTPTYRLLGSPKPQWVEVSVQTIEFEQTWYVPLTASLDIPYDLVTLRLDCPTYSEDYSWRMDFRIEEPYLRRAGQAVELGKHIVFEIGPADGRGEYRIIKHRAPELRWNPMIRQMEYVYYQGSQLWSLEGMGQCSNRLEEVYPELEYIIKASTPDKLARMARFIKLSTHNALQGAVP